MSFLKQVKNKLFGAPKQEQSSPKVERIKTVHIELQKIEDGQIAAPRGIIALISEGYDIIGTVKSTHEQFALSIKNNMLVLNPIL